MHLLLKCNLDASLNSTLLHVRAGWSLMPRAASSWTILRPPVNPMPKVPPSPDAPSPRLWGLPPIVTSDTRLLVLGSFPGGVSLARQQYYAHPQNQFWRILQAIWPSSPCPSCASSYEIRSKWLRDRGLGAWDVYASCEREGSLDTAIRHAQVNDFADLLRHCPQLKAIAHIGTGIRSAQRCSIPLFPARSRYAFSQSQVLPCCI